MDRHPHHSNPGTSFDSWLESELHSNIASICGEPAPQPRYQALRERRSSMSPLRPVIATAAAVLAIGSGAVFAATGGGGLVGSIHPDNHGAVVASAARFNCPSPGGGNAHGQCVASFARQNHGQTEKAQHVTTTGTATTDNDENGAEHAHPVKPADVHGTSTGSHEGNDEHGDSVSGAALNCTPGDSRGECVKPLATAPASDHR
jgi:hypothetical protein